MAGNIMDLPEQLLEDINVLVAKGCGVHALYLSMVNKVFTALYERQSVLRECSLEILPLYPEFEPEDEPRFRRWMKKLRGAENVEALYRKRLEHYFDELRRPTKRSKGLDELTRAANGGSRRAQHILGIILVCLGGVRRAEGYGFLAHLMRLKMSQTIEEVWGKRLKFRSVVIWRSGITVVELLSAYSHGPCDCGDTTADADETLKFLKLAYSHGDQWNLT